MFLAIDNVNWVLFVAEATPNEGNQKAETDLFFRCRPSRLTGFNPDTDMAFNFIDEFVATS